MTAKSSTRAQSSRNGTVDVSERPASFRFAANREWIPCPVEGLEGFQIQVRTDITVAEQRALVDAYNAIRTYADTRWAETGDEERDFSDSPHMRERALIAPYVLNWNAEGIESESGEWHPLPAPADAGPDVFDAITSAALDWIFGVVLVGYYATGKVRPSPLPSAPTGSTPEPSSPDTLDPESSP